MADKKPLGDRGQILVFIGLVLGLSFLVFWGPLAVFQISAANFVQGKVYNPWALGIFILGGFVPSVLGIILTRVFEGPGSVKILLGRAFNFKLGWKSYLGIPLTILVLTLGQVALISALGGRVDLGTFAAQLSSLPALVILGPLSEELGWRGFLQKRMNGVLGPISGALGVGLVWGLWHLPLFFIPGTTQAEFHLPFVVFLITLVGISLVYNYFLEITGGLIFSAIFLHWLQTFSLQVVTSGVQRTEIYNLLEWIPTVVLGLLFLMLLARRSKKV